VGLVSLLRLKVGLVSLLRLKVGLVSLLRLKVSLSEPAIKSFKTEICSVVRR